MKIEQQFHQVCFDPIDQATAEIVIARLSDLAEGFEDGFGFLKMYVKADSGYKAELEAIASGLGLHYEIKDVESENWNALWESNFDPVVVGDFVAVRASFHPPFKNVVHEIVINPKMSFGTGHHATTWMMLQAMEALDFTGKAVFDFGTGTGILAILAEKRGATAILATDIDEWSIANAGENLEINRCTRITLLQSDKALQKGTFDIVVANINKNVLLATIPQLAAQLNKGGYLLLSGLLAEDAPEITGIAGKAGLVFLDKWLKNNWLCLKFRVDN